MERGKKFFGSNNTLHTVRNFHAFHCPENDEIERSFSEIPTEEAWDVYTSTAVANTFFWMSEMVMYEALFRSVNAKDHVAAFKTIADQVLDVSDMVEDILAETMNLTMMAHFPDAEPVEAGPDLADMPRTSDVRLPFFLSEVPATVKDA